MSPNEEGRPTTDGLPTGTDHQPSPSDDAGHNGKPFSFFDYVAGLAADDLTWYERCDRSTQRDADKIRADRGDPRWPGAVPVRPASTPTTVNEIASPGGNPRYVEAAIRSDLERLAAAVEGSRVRNATLYEVACNVFEFVKGGHADESAARAELTRISAANGLLGLEIESTLRSAWNKVGPRTVPAPGGVPPAHTVEYPTEWRERLVRGDDFVLGPDPSMVPVVDCRACGKPLETPESKASGQCLECRLFPPADDDPRGAS